MIKPAKLLQMSANKRDGRTKPTPHIHHFYMVTHQHARHETPADFYSNPQRAEEHLNLHINRTRRDKSSVTAKSPALHEFNG